MVTLQQRPSVSSDVEQSQIRGNQVKYNIYMYSWKYIEKAALSLYYCAFSQQLYYVIKLIYATLARMISFGVIPRSSARLVTTQLLPVTALISSLRPTVILKRSAAHSVAHGSAYRPAGFCP